MKTITITFLMASLSVFSQANVNTQETIEANEASNSQAALDLVLNELMEMSREGSEEAPQFKRGFHNKANACVVGSFEVLPNIPEKLAQGLFSEPQTYPAWIRFSNGSTEFLPDDDLQSRGIAIKVLGTSGPMLQSESGEQYSQDFLMANNPVFFLKSLQELVDDGIAFFNKEYLSIPLSTLNRFNDARSRPVNPLKTEYFSQSAYKLGDFEAVKYRLRPCATNSQVTVDRNANNSIRVALYEGIASQDQCYDFQVQLREDVDTMPIEDPTIEWASPFVSVAQLSIPQQGFNDSSQDDVCETLSFNPWHTVEAHRPLGALNRVRQMVYKMGSNKRRGEPEEPKESSVEDFGDFFNPPSLAGAMQFSIFILLISVLLVRTRK